MPGSNRYLSIGAMVIPSNDAFIGNGDPKAHEGFAADGSFNGPFTVQIYGATVYDAGTEMNDNQGPPFSVIGGESSDEGGVVGIHSGLESFVGTETASGTTIGSGIDSDELLFTIEVSDPTAVPEPSTMAIWGVFVLLGGVFARRRHNR